MERQPEKQQPNPWVLGDVDPLARRSIRVEHESFGVEGFQENRSRARGTVRPHGRQHHGVRFVYLGGDCLGEPTIELHQRIGCCVVHVERSALVVGSKLADPIGHVCDATRVRDTPQVRRVRRIPTLAPHEIAS